MWARRSILPCVSFILWKTSPKSLLQIALGSHWLWPSYKGSMESEYLIILVSKVGSGVCHYGKEGWGWSLKRQPKMFSKNEFLDNWSSLARWKTFILIIMKIFLKYSSFTFSSWSFNHLEYALFLFGVLFLNWKQLFIQQQGNDSQSPRMTFRLTLSPMVIPAFSS